MRSRARKGAAALAATFLAALSLAATLQSGGAAAADDASALAALRARIADLQASLASDEGIRGEATDELRESERAISKANRSYRELARRRDAVQSDIDSLGKRMRAAEASIAARESGLGQLLAATYMSGRSGYFKLLASGADPSQTSRDLHYLSMISIAYSADIDSVRASLEELRSLEVEARQKTLELEGLERVRQAERRELLDQREARRKVLERASARIRAQRREVNALERDELRLSRLVEALDRAIRANPADGIRNARLPEADRLHGPFGGLKGLLHLPTRGVIANRFGTPRLKGGPSWKGIFIRAQEGGEVRAVASGRVVFSDWMRGVGNLLILDHGEGYLTIYGNNESLLKSVGDPVSEGDVVATIGASGGTQESGLYFEIRREGKAFDPLTWVTLR